MGWHCTELRYRETSFLSITDVSKVFKRFQCFHDSIGNVYCFDLKCHPEEKVRFISCGAHEHPANHRQYF